MGVRSLQEWTQFFTPFERNVITMHTGGCNLEVSQKMMLYTHKENGLCVLESRKLFFSRYSPLFIHEISDAAPLAVVSGPRS